jgi:hypothetical protein
MNKTYIQTTAVLMLCVFSILKSMAQEKPGATVPWLTYEAESMKTNGTVLGPKYDPFLVETESSGQKCVKLNASQQFVQFKATKKANAIVIRYSLPDKPEGGGTTSTLVLYKNGKRMQDLDVSSRLTMLYGKYPFSNDPKMGKPRNFYDEVRTKDFPVNESDVVKIVREDKKGNTADFCIIDLVDLEEAPEPLKAPENALSVTDKEFMGNNFTGDYTQAFKQCVGKAWETKKSVWIPAGNYKITGEIMVPANVTIQGAGMWHTVLFGDDSLYEEEPSRRVKFYGNGSNIHISDFSIMGKLNHRDDTEGNDAIVGCYGTNSSISRLWIEHTKIGVWVENCKNFTVEDCRFRNTIADGINFCVGMTESTMKNCTARGTGDDCFAMWPATFILQKFKPGKNSIVHCTAQLPFLANGAAIYGGESNKIANCLFTDISPGSAILISTTFPIEDNKNNNTFSGTTLVENCDIKTSGGFDHSWDWRSAVQICLDKKDISGIELNNVSITNSLSDGIGIVSRLNKDKEPVLSNTVFKNVTVSKYSTGTKGKFAFYIDKNVRGSVTVENSKLSETKNESGGFTITTK